MKSDLTGFILAGGKSSRMGADKFALETNGENFLLRAQNALKPICETVKIVLNQSQNIETALPVVRDIFAERGALGGTHAALKNCDTKFAVILAVDLPLVTVEAIENLAALALENDRIPAVVPHQADGRPQPLCAVYRAEICLPPLEKILTVNENASVRDFLTLISPLFVEQNRLSANEDFLFNVNYPDDFNKLAGSRL